MTRPLLAAALLCAAGLALIAIDPGIDLATTRFFFRPPHDFIADTRIGEIARYTAWTLPFVLLPGLILAAGLRHFGLIARRLAPSPRSALFMALAFGLSPGLLVYGTFKPLAHRPRPHSVVPFGGSERFRPFTAFDGTCHASCSFPSGETAGALWTLAPASLAPPPFEPVAIGAALAFGAATGLLRIAFGGHFLSDVLAAALFTILAVLVARRLVIARRRP